jgi:hypothetical protein
MSACVYDPNATPLLTKSADEEGGKEKSEERSEIIHDTVHLQLAMRPHLPTKLGR